MTGSKIALPSRINSFHEQVAQISSGHSHTMLLTKSGHIFVWGSGQKGQLGMNRDIYCVNIPQDISIHKYLLENDSVYMIKAGLHDCTICTKMGRVYHWGDSISNKPVLVAQWDQSTGCIYDILSIDNVKLILYSSNLDYIYKLYHNDTNGCRATFHMLFTPPTNSRELQAQQQQKFLYLYSTEREESFNEYSHSFHRNKL